MLKTQTPHAWTITVRQHPYPSGVRLMVAVTGRSPASVTSNHRNPPERKINHRRLEKRQCEGDGKNNITCGSHGCQETNECFPV